MGPKQKILIVEDEPRIANFMRTVLVANQYDVITTASGREACSMISSHCPDLIILDMGLPDMDGLEIIQSVRAWTQMPIVVVSARSHERDKVEALDAGADDYVTKPFGTHELLARIRSVLRRGRSGGELVLTLGNVSLEPENGRVRVEGRELPLLKKEFDILLYFMQRPNHLVDKSVLAEAVWGDHADQADNFHFVYAQMKNLRRKLAEAGASLELKAVYGFGYKLVPPTEE